MTEENSRLPLKGTIRRLLRQYMMAGPSARIVLLVLVVMVTFILVAPTRTVQIQARTLSANIEFSKDQTAWNLSGATLCTPSFDFDQVGEAPCGAGEVNQGAIGEPLDWEAGQEFTIDWTPDALLIRSETATETLARGTRIILPTDIAKRNGALSFTGFLSVGEVMRQGATGYVLDGSYAIYEQDLLSLGFGMPADVTRDGQLRRGERVRVVCQDSLFHKCEVSTNGPRSERYRNIVIGSITADHDRKAGFHVVATGTRANSRLEVEYSGIEEKLLIRPNWIDRAVRSSNLLAFSLLFSLIAPVLLPMVQSKSTSATSKK